MELGDDFIGHLVVHDVHYNLLVFSLLEVLAIFLGVSVGAIGTIPMLALRWIEVRNVFLFGRVFMRKWDGCMDSNWPRGSTHSVVEGMI